MFFLSYLWDVLGSALFLTGYVTGNTSFPKPLSDEEEKYYLDRLKKRRCSSKRYFGRKKFKVSGSHSKKIFLSWKRY